MGTRSIINVVENGNTLVSIYQQHAGDLNGVGEKLADFLAPFKLQNGIGGDEELGVQAAGLDCLAAQLVGHFKRKVGGTYLVPRGDHGQEYEYDVVENAGIVWMEVYYVPYKRQRELLFECSPRFYRPTREAYVNNRIVGGEE